MCLNINSKIEKCRTDGQMHHEYVNPVEAGCRQGVLRCEVLESVINLRSCEGNIIRPMGDVAEKWIL